MQPDMQCTGWPDGWPSWIGGTGDEWLHCCVAHDLGGTDIALAQCVAHAGLWPVAAALMGGIMFIGVKALRPFWRLLRK